MSATVLARISIPKKNILFVVVLILLALIALVLFFINEYRIESGKREELLKLAVISAESIDKSFQFWQEQIKQIADISLINNAPIQSNQVLGNIISKSKFFNQLSVFDVNGKFITGSPQNDGALQQFPDAMKNLAKSIEKNNKDIPVIVSNLANNFSKILFIYSIVDQMAPSDLQGFIIGEVDIRGNSLIAGATSVSNIVKKEGGIVVIADKELFQIVNIDTDSKFNLNSNEVAKFIGSSLVIQSPLKTNNWQIIIVYPFTNILKDSVFFSLPGILIILLLCVAWIFWYRDQLRKAPNTISGAIQSSQSVESGISTIERIGLEESATDISSSEMRILNFCHQAVTREGLADLAEVILKYVQINESANIRLIILKGPLSNGNQDNKIFSLGKNVHDYEYLDEQIITMILKDRRIFIPDIRRIKQIRLQPNRDFPISIYAFAIKQNQFTQGVLWIGFEKYYQISEIQMNYLESIIKVSSILVSRIVASDNLHNKINNMNRTLDFLNAPILIINSNYRVVFANEASAILDKRLPVMIDADISKIMDKKILDSMYKINVEDKKEELITIENNTYQVKRQKFDQNEKVYDLFIFYNCTEEKVKEDIFELQRATLFQSLHLPLSIVKGYGAMLPLMGPLNDKQRVYSEKILSSVDEMSALLKDMLNSERMETGNGIIKKEFIVVDLIDEAVNELSPLASQKKIEIIKNYKISPDDLMNGDRILIKIAINNLIENAINFSHIEGKINVETGRERNTLIISVQDKGIGIASVDLPFIFEKSYRVKSDVNESVYSSGIGLALTKSIIERHNGEITVDSHLGTGTKFVVKLPC